MSTTNRVLRYLAKHGPSCAGEVGSVFGARRGRVSSVNGGGDYAAQMLLGRMRKLGLVRTEHSNDAGASRWMITPHGIDVLRGWDAP